MSVQSYRDLIVWQKAMDLVEMIYQATKAFPKEELYGLTNQLRRAAVSIPSNIAEGHARSSTQEFYRFLSIARGSLAEVETQLLIAQRLGLLSAENLSPILSLQIEINKMTNGLMAKLASNPSPLVPNSSPLVPNSSPLTPRPSLLTPRPSPHEIRKPYPIRPD